MKVGISHIRGTAEVKLHLAEAKRPQRAVFQGKGSLVGGSMNLTATFDLAEAGEGTRVAWKGEAQIFGRLISVAGGLLEPLAKKNVQKLIDGLQAALT
jgi:carbon monoxide dehydrogenase subunit G